MINLIEIPEKKKNDCKGLFWRGSVTTFISSFNSIETRKSLRLLKRMSCLGCEHCSWVFEHLQEELHNQPDDYLQKIKHGVIYTYNVWVSRGFEDTHDEIDFIDFVETTPPSGSKK